MASPTATPMRVFGVPLPVLMAHPSQRIIPTVIKKIIAVLHGRGMIVEGIFKKAPEPFDLETTKQLIDTDIRGEHAYDTMDPHMLAALLKQFLRELPDPLFTHKLFPDFIKAEHRVDELRRLVQRELPPQNKAFAEVLFLFLTMVAGHASSNKLTAYELATIFAPLLLRPQAETPESLGDVTKRAKIVHVMMANFDKMFPKGTQKKTIIKRQDTPEIMQQKQKLNTLKASLREAVTSLSQQFADLTNDLEQAESLEEMAAIVQALKGIKGNMGQYTDSRRPKYEGASKHSAVCTTLLESGHFSLQGRRPTLEDEVVLMDNMNSTFTILSKHLNRSMFCVFDGHAGVETAKLATELLPTAIATDVAFEDGRICESLRSGIQKTDQLILDRANAATGGFASGSTAVVVTIVGETLYIANVGDSEALIGRRKADYQSNPKPYEPMVISFKHKPTDDAERDRISKAGAAVFRGRIFGRLAVSRALGDCEFKPPKAKGYYVTSEPYTNEMQLDETYDFIVMACDGLFDKVNYQEVVDLVGELKKQGKNPTDISEALCQASFQKGSMDNISVIVIFLNWRSVM